MDENTVRQALSPRHYAGRLIQKSEIALIDEHGNVHEGTQDIIIDYATIKRLTEMISDKLGLNT